MNLYRNLFRLRFLYSQFDFQELCSLLYQYGFQRQNFIKTHDFSELCVMLHQADAELKSRKDTKKNLLQTLVNTRFFQVEVRRKTSDFFIYYQVFIRKDYQDLIDHILSHLSATDIRFVVDAGANIGASALYFHSFFPDALIVAIEPESSNFRQLYTNIKLNNLEKHIYPIQAALWHKVEKLFLGNDFRDKSNDAFTVSANAEKNIGETEGITLKNILNQYSFPCIDLLKMDIEGAEKYIFEDADTLKTILPFVRYIAVEVHEEIISRQAVIQILREAGFAYFESGEYCIGQNKQFV